MTKLRRSSGMYCYSELIFSVTDVLCSRIVIVTVTRYYKNARALDKNVCSLENGNMQVSFFRRVESYVQ